MGMRALGEARALVYLLAAGAGLRRNEMYGLAWKDIDFDDQIIRIVAKSAKSKKDQAVPLHADLGAALLKARAGRGPCDPVIPKGSFPRHETFTADLKAAKISKVDDQGRTVDLHALRGTMLTWLKDAGVHPAVAQRAARHAKVDTTIRHYTHVVDEEVRAALAKVPLVREPSDGDEGVVR